MSSPDHFLCNQIRCRCQNSLMTSAKVKEMNMIRDQLKLLQVRSMMQVVLVFLSVFLLQIMGTLLWTGVCMALHYTPEKSTMLQQISILSSVFIILWCGHLYRQSAWRVHPFDYGSAFSVKMVMCLVMVGMGGCTVMFFLLTFLSGLLPQLFVHYNKIMNQFGQGDMVWILLYALLFGPIAEELIFRGAILDRLYLAFPFWMANLIQAALFGLYHGNLIQGLYAFAWGILLGLIRQAVGSILANSLAHIIFNSTNYLLNWMFAGEEAVSIPLYIGTFLVGIIFFGVGLWYTITVYAKKRLRENGD